jgi:DNA-directed RNA polymerase subunit M/transcription elongation factor TFIIS
MAGSQSVVAEVSHVSNAVLAHSSTSPPQPSRHDTFSSHISDEYSPLPPGRWTFDFHGNCPRCYHRHSAVQVQVKVTHDASQVSYVHCERCKERWAAFGGRNTTRISLLSNATIDPDPIERGVRYSLIDIVKLATAAASLGTLPEASSSHVPSRQPSVNSTTDDVSCSTPSPRRPSSSIKTSEDISPAEVCEHNQRLEPAPSLSAEHTNVAKNRSSPYRLLFKLKKKIMVRFSILQRDPKPIVGTSKQPRKSPRQLEKSPIQTQTAADQDIVLTAQSSTTVPAQDALVATDATMSEATEVEVAGRCKRLAEVVAFVASLDKSVLNSKNEQERAQWMREVYTEFKARRGRGEAHLGISTIVHTSIPCELPRSPQIPLDRRSVEVLHAGTHIEGLELIEAALRRGSITISEPNTDAQSASDERTVASFPRYARQQFLQRVQRGLWTHRPLSVDGATQSMPHLRSRLRHSYDAAMPTRADSTSSVHGQASSRWSATTLHDGSTHTGHGPVSEDTVHRAANHEGHDDEVPNSIPLPPSASEDDSNYTR